MSQATLDYDAARDAAISCIYGAAGLSGWAAAVLDCPGWDPAEIQAEGARVIGRVARTYDRARRAISDQILDAIELEAAKRGESRGIIVRLPPEVGGGEPREIHYLTCHEASTRPAQELIEAAAAVAGWEGRYRQKVRRTTIDFLLPAGKADAGDYEAALAEPADDADDARAYWTDLLHRLAVCGPDDPQQREVEIRREWAAVKAAAIGAAGEPAGDQVDGKWSAPESPAQWAKRFNCSVDTLTRRLVKRGKIRVNVLTSKLWQVHLDDLPKS